MLRSIGGFFFGNAAFRVAGAVLNGIVAGVLTNWLIVVVTDDDGTIDWSAAPTTTPGYCLVLFSVVAVAYAIGLHRHDTDILRWNDTAYQRALLTRELFPEVVAGLRRRLRDQPVESLEDLRGILGS